jgi:hypothetical protein
VGYLVESHRLGIHCGNAILQPARSTGPLRDSQPIAKIGVQTAVFPLAITRVPEEGPCTRYSTVSTGTIVTWLRF